MSAQMAVDAPKPPKLDLDVFISTALSATPADLHPYFEAFRTLHTRKCVLTHLDRPCQLGDLPDDLSALIDYGISCP